MNSHPKAAGHQKQPSFSRNEIKMSPFTSSLFQLQHHSAGQPQLASSNGPNRPIFTSKYSFRNWNENPHPSPSPQKDTYAISAKSSTKLSGQREPDVPRSSGLLYSSTANTDLSSIDKVNDPRSKALVCCGKSHLGYYKFSEETHTIVCQQEVSLNPNMTTHSPVLSKRSKKLKFSTTADVKCGFHNYSNYVAACTSSTIISLYDLNSLSTNPLITSLSAHTRAVNSFDFNMNQANLLVSGGQDGFIKIWDLRSNSGSSQGRCEINISTGSDSIRDVKWMPSYNYAPVDSISPERKSANTGGYNFASIHDSGTLLKFDLRQPSQYERKISAHTGPGLCLNWHPNQEYIVTGGRDGKCSLWNVSNNVQDASATHLSTFYSPSAHITHSSTQFPETTINTGFPITKLKFRPTADKNVMNSLLALSSMGDEAAVHVYSLARKYIPKHVLLTSTPSIGVVWWDEHLVFNIDRGNNINGWNINNEPTVLDNLHTRTVRWRDIDGNGLLMVNQNPGSYEAPVQHTVERKKALAHRMQMSVFHSNAGNINNNNHNTNLLGRAKIMDTFKKGAAMHAPTSTHRASSILSFSGSTSRNNSVVSSLISSSPANDGRPADFMPGPTIITVDLAHILNSIKKKHFKASKPKPASLEEELLLQKSPIQLFQFLARELDFSTMQDHELDASVKNKAIVSHNEENNDELKKDLAKRFGLNNTTTWTNMINNQNDNGDSEILTKTISTISADNISEEQKSEDIKTRSSEISRNLPMTPSTESNKNVSTTEENNSFNTQVEKLVQLITVCSHNASVYSYIKDLPNAKIWILIRDSLLWDLKSLTAEQETTEDFDNTSTPSVQSSGHGSPKSSIIRGKPNSNSSAFSITDEESLQKKRPQAFRSTSDRSIINTAKTGKISRLRRQLEKNRDLESEVTDEDKSALQRQEEQENPIISKESTERPRLSEDAIMEEDDSFKPDADDVVSSSHGTRPATAIPISTKRKQRLSFIDTFMKTSPGLLGENDIFNRHRNSMSQALFDQDNKISSVQSLKASLSSLKGWPKHSFSPSPRTSLPFNNEFDTSPHDTTNISHSAATDQSGAENIARVAETPPWSTRKLIKQFYIQTVETGNILLAINLLTLFQNIYKITSFEVVKNSFAYFIDILHRYELFEIAAALLKYCPWENILDKEGGQSTVQIICEKCGKVITNAESKESYNKGYQTDGNGNFPKFGYWYCDSCKKPNTLCVYCEKPMTQLAICVLECGHEGHFACFKKWFLDEKMNECPGGCLVGACGL